VVDPTSLEQFEISDDRTLKQISDLIKQNGYEPVYKDWDRQFN
jgi:2-iminoacetate synthase